MLPTNNNVDFKQVNKNLKTELSKMGFNISNQSCLNLTSRALGFADYNTYNALIKKEQSKEISGFTGLLLYANISNDDANEFVQWVEKSPFKNFRELITKSLTEIIDDTTFVDKWQLYLFAYEILVYEKIDLFMREFEITCSLMSRYEQSQDNKLLNMAKQISKGSFYEKEYEEYIEGIYYKDSLKKAVEYAIKYDNTDTRISSDTLRSGLIVEIIDYLDEPHEYGFQIDVEEFNSTGEYLLSDEVLEELLELEYTLVSKQTGETVGVFKPIHYGSISKDGLAYIQVNKLTRKHVGEMR